MIQHHRIGGHRAELAGALALALALALCACGTTGSDPADAGGPDGGIWWHDCFPAGATLCGRDWTLPADAPGLATPVTSQWTTPLLAMDDTPFAVADTQATGPAPPVPQTLDATWVGFSPLPTPSPFADRARPPLSALSFDTATAGRWTLAVALDETTLFYVLSGEPVTVTLYEGLAVHRAEDGALLLRLADRRGWDSSGALPDPPPVETLPAAGLELAPLETDACLGVEGIPTGNRAYGLSGLRVTSAAGTEALAPGEDTIVTTPGGIFQVRHLATWHRAPSTCAQYADITPWRASYEIVRMGSSPES